MLVCQRMLVSHPFTYFVRLLSLLGLFHFFSKHFFVHLISQIRLTISKTHLISLAPTISLLRQFQSQTISAFINMDKSQDPKDTSSDSGSDITILRRSPFSYTTHHPNRASLSLGSETIQDK